MGSHAIARDPVLLGGAILVWMVATTPAASGGLADLTRIAVSVHMAHPVEDVSGAELEARLAAFVAALAPPVALDPASPDRLRLTIDVRARDSSALRGFWLPFSGTYAIGSVRLGLERVVRLPGRVPREIAAIVWQRERFIATRWTASGEAIAGAVGELLDALRKAGAGQTLWIAPSFSSSSIRSDP
jgi:hypothetical protein